MKMQKSTLAHLEAIMSIIDDAQKYLASLNIDQWQDGYPNEEQIKLDIENNDSYIVVDETEKIIGTTVFTTKKEPTYNKIEGKWLTEGNTKYGVIHRLAVSDEYRKSGFSKFVFDYCEKKLIEQEIASMRIDTHKDNIGMQGLLKKMGYKYCGVIILTSGAERLAFEKVF
jgi:ribosomal protein S18 acetylase RimI-like enzyme